jgi:hypothetical protein
MKKALIGICLAAMVVGGFAVVANHQSQPQHLADPGGGVRPTY